METVCKTNNDACRTKTKSHLYQIFKSFIYLFCAFQEQCNAIALKDLSIIENNFSYTTLTRTFKDKKLSSTK